MVGEQGPGVERGLGRDQTGHEDRAVFHIRYDLPAVQSAADDVVQGPWGIESPGDASAVSRTLPKDAPSPSGGPGGALARTAVAHEDGDGQQKEVKGATLPSASVGTETLS